MVICINDSSADSCLEDGDSNGGSTEGVNCYYDKSLGVTQCNAVLDDGSIAGYWDPKTFSCSNLVAPVVNSIGEITCPPTTPVTIKSTSTPDPSKDDVACDPTIAPDPNNSDSGCASQKTLAKTNDLISESNSKLGAISGGTAANTGLLKEISGTLKAIAGQGSPSSPDPDNTDCSLFPNEPSCIDKKQISMLSPSISSSGSCPSPETFSILSGNYEFSYEPVCNFLDSIRGLVVAMGALSALLIVVTAL